MKNKKRVHPIWQNVKRSRLVWPALVLFLIAATVFGVAAESSPRKIWQTLTAAFTAAPIASAPAQSAPAQHNFQLQMSDVARMVSGAPLEASGVRAANSPVQLTLPMPDGRLRRYRLLDSPIITPEMAAKYPDIKSYTAQGVEDPSATARFSWTSRGLHGVILGNDYSVFIHPVDHTTTVNYVSYYGQQDDRFECGVTDDTPGTRMRGPQPGVNLKNGNTLRVYRWAIATPGEYTTNPAYGGGTVASTVASLNIWVNQTNAVYEREAAIRFTLVNNTSIIYTDAATDPFTNPTSTTTALTEVRATLASVVGVANYDLGHVLLVGDTGGVAYGSVVCDSAGIANKGGGVSGVTLPLGSAYGSSRLMHETAHQFGVGHTFNDGESNGCASNRAQSTSYESGSGLSILAYPHICLKISSTTGNGRVLYFHNGSLTQMMNYVAGRGGTCGTTALSGNTPPTVSGGPDRTIPRNTPFTLTAAGSDPDVNDAAALTYAWEQIDSGNALYFQTSNPASFKDAGDPADTTRPIFRPFAPTPNPARTFPSLTYILNNANVPPDQVGGLWTAEHLSNITRQINFRITLRDNRAGGGAFSDDHVVLNVDGNSGPFLVTAPNTAASLPAGSMQTVTWSVNNTNLAPINCANVKISLSTDGGLTFPTVLIGSTPNDGSEVVTLPALASTVTTARIKVEAADNIFFDISDANFTIASGVSCPAVTSFAPAAGNTGTSVKIFGTGLTSVTAVKFSNNVAATFTVNNDNQITVTQPAGAVSGPITISKAGCADTLTTAYIVCPAAASTLSVDDNGIEQMTSARYVVNRLTPATYPATLQSVSIRIESTQNLQLNTPFILLYGVNADGDGDINNTSFQTMNATVSALGTFVRYDLPQPITIQSGDFVVGYNFPNGGQTALLDTTAPQGRSYSSTDGLNFTTGITPNNTQANLFIRAGVLIGCGLGAAACPTVSGISPSNGQIGDTVTINGTGFSGVTTVKFNSNIIANFTIVSDTQITATVPANTTSGAITISEPNCSDAVTAGFTVNAPVCMTVTGFSPASALPGVPITITGTNFTGASVVKFSGDAAAVFTVDSPTQITAIVPPGTGFGPITISKQGCADVQTANFTPCNSSLALQIDDGSSNSNSGYAGPITMYLVSRLTPAVYPATLTTVQIAVASASVPVGTAINVLAAANPTGSNAINGISFQSQPGVTGATGLYASYTLTNPITINSGDFVIGYSISIPSATTWFVEGRDLDNPQGRSYRSSNAGATFTLSNGNANYLIRGVYQRPCCSGVTVAVNPTNPALPGALLGTPYTQNFTQTGGVGAITWSVSAGALPAGLTLNPTTGALTGTPTAIGSANFTIRATDQNNCSGEQAYTLAVTCSPIAVSPNSLPDGTVGTTYNQTLSASPAGSYGFGVTSGALPTGLMLDGSGNLTGTPTQSGAFNFTVTATSAVGGCTGTRTYSMTIGCPTITLSPTTLPDGSIGVAYNQSLTGGSLSGAYTFAVTGGALPTGLMLSSGGLLNGTPSTATGSPFSFTVTATHTASGCTGSQSYVVNVACPTITLNPTTLPDATVGDVYNQTITASPAGSYTFAVTGGALPAGTNLTGGGVLSGTTSAAGVFNFTVTATGAGGCTGEQSYTVTIASPFCAPIPANLTSWWKAESNAGDATNANNGTLQGSAAFAAGKVNQAFSFNGTNGYVGLPDSFFPFPASGTGNTPFTFEAWFKTSTGGVIFGQQQANAPYTGTPPNYVPGVYVGTNGKLHVELFWFGTVNPIISAASVNDNVFHHVAVVYDGTNETVYLDGSLAGSVAATQVSYTSSYKYQFGTGWTAGGWPNVPGGWYNFNGLIDEPTLYSRALTAGEVQSIVTAGSRGKCCAIAIAQTTLPDGTLGIAYNQTITTSGNVGAVTFTSSGTLPPGVTLSSGGVLSNAPTQSGLFNFTVTATDAANCSVSQAYTVAVNCPTISFSPSVLPVASVGAAYGQTITAGPGSYNFAVTAGALPSGVTLTSGGALSGMPAQTGTFAFTVTATNLVGGCSANQVYQLQVNCPIIMLTPGTLPGGTVGATYNQTITPSGLAGAYVFALDDGALPTGLTLNPTTGQLSGTLTQGGTFSFIVRATHTVSGCIGTQSFTINIVCPTINITPATLASGFVGTTYNQSLAAGGGTPGYAFSPAPGSSLPPGLSLGANGAVTGTPSLPGVYSFAVTATDNYGCTGTANISLTIGGCNVITVNPPAISTGTLGITYSQTFTQSGGQGTTVFSTPGPLPAGITLSPSGVLSGTPGQVGAFPITVTATDSFNCAGTTNFTLTINCPTITLSALTGGTAGTAYSQTLTASPAGGGYSFAVTAGSLPPGLSLNGANGLVSGTPSLAGTFNFTVTASGSGGFGGCTGAQAYSVAIACPTITLSPTTLPAATGGAAYSQTFTAAPAGTAYSFAVTNGALPAGLTLAANGTLSGTTTQSGSFSFRVTATGFGGCSGFRDYTLSVGGCSPITVDPATLPGGTVGTAYNQTVSGNPAGAYSYSVTAGALPTGLTLNAGTGTITGTPSQRGTYNFTVTATSGSCSGSRAYSVVIGCPGLTVSSLPSGVIGTAYNSNINVTPTGSYTYSVSSGSLPAGLSLNTSTGFLTGTPTTAGSSTFTIRITASGGCIYGANYTVAINCPTITLSALTTPTLNAAYSQTVTAAPAGGNYSFAVTTGALPAGLTLNQISGAISGTPTVAGTFNFTITATGFGTCTGSRAYSFVIAPGACPTITLATLPNGNAGELYINYAQANPSGTYTYAVTAGSLPPGLTLYNSVGMLYGYPTVNGTYNFTIQATDAANCQGQRAYTVVIGGAQRPAVSNDFSGDRKSDFVLWRADQRQWLIVDSAAGTTQTLQWGQAGDRAVAGDFDGDGKADPAGFGKDGHWRIKRSSDGATLDKLWGLGSDVPVPGDYDGDGKTDLAVWRGAESGWYIERSSDNKTESVLWGSSLAPYFDVPVPGDYDGDGKTDIAVFRQASGKEGGHWYIRRSSDGKVMDKVWGLGTDVPVAADYDGDGKTDLAVWRGSEGVWYIVQSSDGAVRSKLWGVAYAPYHDAPATGDFDGDGKADLAVWRESDGRWYIIQSSDGATRTVSQGRSGDAPVGGR